MYIYEFLFGEYTLIKFKFITWKYCPEVFGRYYYQ